MFDWHSAKKKNIPKDFTIWRLAILPLCSYESTPLFLLSCTWRAATRCVPPESKYKKRDHVGKPLKLTEKQINWVVLVMVLGGGGSGPTGLHSGLFSWWLHPSLGRITALTAAKWDVGGWHACCSHALIEQSETCYVQVLMPVWIPTWGAMWWSNCSFSRGAVVRDNSGGIFSLAKFKMNAFFDPCVCVCVCASKAFQLLFSTVPLQPADKWQAGRALLEFSPP